MLLSPNVLQWDYFLLSNKHTGNYRNTMKNMQCLTNLYNRGGGTGCKVGRSLTRLVNASQVISIFLVHTLSLKYVPTKALQCM